MPNRDKRGIILFIVIGVIMVVVILSTITLRVVASHSRLTHHQVSRIQAQYAAKAGVIYALDKLRRGDDCWPLSDFSYIMYMKSSGSGCDVIEPALPSSVSRVDITVGAPDSGVVPGTRKVSAKAIYTYDELATPTTSPTSPTPPTTTPIPPTPPLCFVVTATMGDEMHPFVLILKEFRDKCLTKAPGGRAFINYYYTHGPYFASLIIKNKILRFFSLTLIVYPSVQLAKFLLNRRQGLGSSASSL